MPLTDQGYRAPRAADVLEEIRSDFEALSGLSPNWERDGVLGPLTAVVAQRLGDVYQVTQAIYDARDPNNATGVQLSTLGLATGVERQDATFSRTLMAFEGEPGTSIPAGTIVQGGGADGKAKWATIEDASIPMEGDDKVIVWAECTEAGAITAGEGEIDTMVTPIFGVESVGNGGVIVGRPREDDAEFRARRQASLQIAGSSSASAIRAAVLATGHVEACVVLFNDDALPATIEGVAMDPNSVAVVVWPYGLPDDQMADVVRAIYSRVAAGTKTMGNPFTIINAVGLEETVGVVPATDVPVQVSINVEMEKPSLGNPHPRAFADVVDEIKAAVIEYGKTLQLGFDVRRLPILAAIDEIEDVRSVVQLNLYGAPLDAAGNLKLVATERATFDPDDIYVYDVGA